MGTKSALSKQSKLAGFPYDRVTNKRVAITVTGSMQKLDELIHELATIQAGVLLLCHDDERDQLTATYPTVKMISAPRAGLYGMKIKPAAVSELRRFRPSVTIVMYRNIDGSQHKRAELLAFLSNAPLLLGADKDGVFHVLTRSFLFYQAAEPVVKLIYKPLRSLGYTIAMLAYLTYRGLRSE